MSRVGFEPTILAGERPKTYALDRAATGTDRWFYYKDIYYDARSHERKTGLQIVKCNNKYALK